MAQTLGEGERVANCSFYTSTSKRNSVVMYVSSFICIAVRCSVTRHTHLCPFRNISRLVSQFRVHFSIVLVVEKTDTYLVLNSLFGTGCALVSSFTFLCSGLGYTWVELGCLPRKHLRAVDLGRSTRRERPSERLRDTERRRGRG